MEFIGVFLLLAIAVAWLASPILLWKSKQRKGLLQYLIHLGAATLFSVIFIYVYSETCTGFLCGLDGIAFAALVDGVWGIVLFTYAIVSVYRMPKSN